MLRRFYLPSVFLPLFVWAFFSPSLSAQQLNSKDPLWGFDGKKLAGRFNLFSVSLTNIGSQTYDGNLTLSSDSGTSQSQPIYLAPGQERIVQFYFYVANSYDTYSLSWRGGNTRLAGGGGGAGSEEGPPATILLIPDEQLSPKVTDIRAFPEGRFPTSVVGTSNLHAAILDHIPRWDPVRRVAFIDWVRGGGIAVIGQEVGGTFPNFTGELADLNPTSTPPETFHLGSGLVVHLESSGTALTKSALSKAGIEPVAHFNSDSSYEIESRITSHLGAITNPEISWGLIFFVAFLYVLAVGPIHFLWGRRQKKALVSIGAFLATVALFSWLFMVIGRRGYGESTQAYSLSIANDIGEGNYDVTQWSSVFVTSGDTYKLTHPAAESNYYARASDRSNFTRFDITSGKDGFIEAEIPLFSHSNFVHRAKLPAPAIQPTVAVWKSEGDRLKQLELSLPENFPAVADAWVRHQGWFYDLNRNGSKLVLSSGSPTRQDQFLSSQNVWRIHGGDEYYYGSYRNRQTGESKNAREKRAFENVRHLLIAVATAGSSEISATFERPFESAPDRAELFIYAESPQSFHLGEPFAASENGRTLYRSTIYAPDPS